MNERRISWLLVIGNINSKVIFMKNMGGFEARKEIPGAVFNRVKLEFLAAMMRENSDGGAAARKPLFQYIKGKIEGARSAINDYSDADLLLKLFETYEAGLNGAPDEADLLRETFAALSGEESAKEYLLDCGAPPADCDPENPAAEPWLSELRRLYEKRKPQASMQNCEADGKGLAPDLFKAMEGKEVSALKQAENAEFHEYTSAALECRCIARRIRAMLAGEARAGNKTGSRVMPEDILLLIPDNQDYKNLLKRELDCLGLPHDLTRFAKLSETPCGVFASRILSTAEKERVSRDDIAALVSSRFVSQKALFGDSRQNARKFIESLGEHKIAGGTWAELETALDKLIEYHKTLAGTADAEPKTLAKLRDFKDGYDSCVRKLSGIFKDWKTIKEAGAHAKKLGEALKSLGVMRKLRASENAAIEEDGEKGEDTADSGRAFGALLSVISEMSRAKGAMTAGAFRARLADRMSEKLFSTSLKYAENIKVRSLRELEKGSWKYVFAAGMTENGIAAPSPGPALIDENLLGALGLETNEEREARMNSALMRALRFAGERLIMSFSLRSSDGGQSLPCALLQNLEDALTVKTPEGFFISKFRKNAFLPDSERWTVFHSENELLPLSPEQVISESNAELYRLLHGREPQEKYCMSAKEWFNPENWKEDSAPGSSKVNFGPPPKRLIISPSKLDSFGGCPYRYFAESILGLSEQEEASPEPDAMTSGSAVHTALEKTVKTLVKENTDFADSSKFEDNSRRFASLVNENLKDEFAKISRLSAGVSAAATDALRDKWSIKLKGFTEELFKQSLEDLRNKKGENVVELIRGSFPLPAKKRAKPTKAELALQLLDRILSGDIPDEEEIPSQQTNFKILINHLKKWAPNFSPACCEWRFGSSQEPYILKIDCGSVKEIELSGVIDRIDCGKDENGEICLRVADYKSAKNQHFEEYTKKGIKLQAPLYALIIEDALKRGKDVPAGLKAFQGGKLAKAAIYALKEDNTAEEIDCAENIECFRKWIKLAAEHIFSGKLGPASKAGCAISDFSGYCKFASLCRADSSPAGKFEYSDLRAEEIAADNNKQEKEAEA